MMQRGLPLFNRTTMNPRLSEPSTDRILTLARPIILVVILLFLFTTHASPAIHGVPQTPVALGILGEGYSTPDIVDPELVIGAVLNVTVVVDNIPPIIDASQGGLQGFDISISYNSTMLNVVDIGLRPYYCSSSDGCLYSNANENQMLILNNTIDSANGIARFAAITTDPGLRAPDAGVLFKISFKILALGFTTISIIQNVSQLYGFSNHCAQFLSYTAANATLDNRRPFRLIANPSSLLFSPDQSKSANVTVYRVNSAGDGDVTLLLSGIATTQITYSFNPRTASLNGPHGVFSFNSNLTISTSPGTSIATYHLEIIAQLSSTLNQLHQARLNFTLYVGTQPGSIPAIITPIHSPSFQGSDSNTLTTTAPRYPSLPLLGRFNIITATIAGAPVTFTQNVCGGTAPYQASWKFGDGNYTTTKQDREGIGASTSHTYAAPGPYQVNLIITDGTGQTFTTSQTITVSPIPQASPLMGTIAAATVVLAIALILAVVYIRRRGRS
ncbi:PKD domain-containing protein [Candidatus Bathyarchaeota archaeon]|nr:MAG: PKD domain-containing protein [Candidatus Bathyarchaeota archaeon]